MRLILASVAVVALWFNGLPSAEAAPAFPGAVGFGAEAKGGYGGKIVEVTTLDPIGPGSFAEALNAVTHAEAPEGSCERHSRIIVFKVGGTIDYARPDVPLTARSLKLDKPCVTIAGHTAPGDGITIKGAVFTIASQDVVIRHVRFRPGLGAGSNPASADAVHITNAQRVILDHVSMSWNMDETLSITRGASDITIQNCIITEALNCVPSPFGHSSDEECHSKAMMQTFGARRVTFKDNLISNALDRTPLVTTGEAEYINNVIFNYLGAFYLTPDDSTVPLRANVIGNWFQPGPNTRYKYHRHIRLVTRARGNPVLCARDPDSWDCSGAAAAARVYLKGNIYSHKGDEKSADIYREKKECRSSVASDCHYDRIPELRSRHEDLPTKNVKSARQALDYVLANAGATVPVRDPVDQRALNQVRTGNGRMINQPCEVGGHPILESGTPHADSDSDGLPDAWDIGEATPERVAAYLEDVGQGRRGREPAKGGRLGPDLCVGQKSERAPRLVILARNQSTEIMAFGRRVGTNFTYTPPTRGDDGTEIEFHHRLAGSTDEWSVGGVAQAPFTDRSPAVWVTPRNWAPGLHEVSVVRKNGLGVALNNPGDEMMKVAITSAPTGALSRSTNAPVKAADPFDVSVKGRDTDGNLARIEIQARGPVGVHDEWKVVAWKAIPGAAGTAVNEVLRPRIGVAGVTDALGDYDVRAVLYDSFGAVGISGVIRVRVVQ